MRGALRRFCTLQGVNASDIWALYSRVLPIVSTTASSLNEKKLGQSLRALRERVERAEQEAAEAAELLESSDSCAELRELAVSEYDDVRNRGAEDAAALIDALAKRVDADADEAGDGMRGALLEVRAGTGGSEASLFVSDLLTMYERLAGRRRWKWRVVDSSATDVGGFREVAVSVNGAGVYDALAGEAGVHRVQRVPVTESGGRLHTSTATVSVLRAANGRDENVQIDPSDVRVDVFRASGAGGQHVNTTESAVRVTHIPTGLVATSQDERSQHRNRALAMEALKARVAAVQRQRKAEDRARAKRAQMGASASGGQRSDRIRTYNFAQGRVTDHRIVPDAALLKIVPSAAQALGDKSAPLAAVLRGEEPLDRIMQAVSRVRKFENLKRLVESADRQAEKAMSASA